MLSLCFNLVGSVHCINLHLFIDYNLVKASAIENLTHGLCMLNEIKL